MPGAVVQVPGMNAWIKELRAVDKSFPKLATRLHKEGANAAAQIARGRAASLGGIHRLAAPAIKGYATPVQAQVAASRTAAYPMALAAVWGVKPDGNTRGGVGRSGWYRDIRYAASTGRQFPDWVGSKWEAGARGQGPYAINDAVADYAPVWVEKWSKGWDEITRQAFPD